MFIRKRCIWLSLGGSETLGDIGGNETLGDTGYTVMVGTQVTWFTHRLWMTSIELVRVLQRNRTNRRHIYMMYD